MGETIEAFKSSWESSQGNDFASRMARRSLESLAVQRSDLNEILTDLKKPLQESLDLHLDGEGVKGHSTDAASLGTFMVQVAEAVKQIAKGIAGRKKWNYSLVAVAPQPGSVRLHFQVPPTKLGPDMYDEQPATADAQALRSMANLLVQAESDSDSLDAAAQQLSGPARVAMKHLAETVVKSHWRFDGKLEARGRPTVELNLSEAGAQRLYRASSETETQILPVTFIGECDGWTWSTGTMRFLPDKARPLNASVPPVLQAEVAQLVSAPDTRIEAKFMATYITASGSEKRHRTSYALVSFEVQTK